MFDDDLEFRNRDDDGKNVAIWIVATLIAIPVFSYVGEPALYLLAGATVGWLIGHFSKR